MNIEDIKEIVQCKYNITVDEIEKIKNVYRINSKGEIYCLKVIKYELPHFFFIYSAMRYLQDNGFKNIPEFIKTVNGDEYIDLGDNHAYLTPWLNAREANYDNPIDVKIAALKLAELHNHSEGFEVTSDMKPRYYWGKWIENFTTRKSEILDFKGKILTKPILTEFDNLYHEAIEEEIKRCDRSIKHLMDAKYLDIMKKQEANKSFCHHDYANHNVLINNPEEVSMIDFDYCILDTHLHDLGSLLIRRMKDGKWSMDNALYILKNYDSLRKLQDSDIPILAAFIEFPQAFWQVGLQYYWEKQPWEEEVFMKKLKRVLEDREERQEFVDEFRMFKL